MPFNNPLPINAFVAEFYTLEALQLILSESKNYEPFKKSHERFKYDLVSYKVSFEKELAVVMRDYLVLASVGEARHAYSNCEYHYDNLPRGGDRSSASYHVMDHCTWQSLAESMLELFQNYPWRGAYGGGLWANIARGALLYEQLATTAFIDHCIDLSHNGGSAFDKADYNIFTLRSDYARFLERKSSACHPRHLLEAVITFFMWEGTSFRLSGLLQRAVNLGFLEEWFLQRYLLNNVDYVSKLFSYEPIEWGMNIFQSALVSSCSGSCGDCPNTDCDDNYSNCEGDCDWDCNNDQCSKHPCQNDMCDECPNTACANNPSYCNGLCEESCGVTDCSSHPCNNVEDEEDEEEFECINKTVFLQGELKELSEEVVLNVRKKKKEKEKESDAA